MLRLKPKLALPVGIAVTSLGLLLTTLQPFGASDVADGAHGLVVGLGFGLTLAGLLKRGKAA